MGESYFTHIGITPHRIYPFVVTNMRGGADGFTHGTVSVTPLKDLWKLCYWDNHDSFMKCVGQAYQRLFNSDQGLLNDFGLSMSDGYAKSRVSESTVLSLSNTLPTSNPSSSQPFQSSSSTSTTTDDKGSSGSAGTAGMAGPNDDVAGEDFKANNKPRSLPGGIRVPKAPV